MNRVLCISHKFINHIVAFMLCLAVFFGIASEATVAAADCAKIPCGKPNCIQISNFKKCSCKSSARGCQYEANADSCKCSIGLPSEYGQAPIDLSSSPNSDPFPPSSGAVAPSIGNPAP